MTHLLQIYPSRISVTPARKKKQFHEMDFNYQNPSYKDYHKAQAVKNFAKDKNPFKISKASKKKIMDSINSMYQLSPARKVEMKTGKFIYNYKMSFVTLTLPSKQIHSDTQIKKDCLNQFLVELRKHYKIDNYVWKAELQKNENIHFHLILDKYIDFQALRRRWNRCIDKLGYVKAYQEKMSSLSFQEYRNLYDQGKNLDYKLLTERFAAGNRSGWKNPNTVDVKSVSNKKDIASYLAKYITKSFSNENADETTAERQKSFGRSWSRSYSLVKLKYKNKYTLEEMQHLINYLESIPEKVKKVTGDFFTVYFFNPLKLNAAFRSFHHKFIVNNSKLYNYPIPNI